MDSEGGATSSATVDVRCCNGTEGLDLALVSGRIIGVVRGNLLTFCGTCVKDDNDCKKSL